MSLDLGHLIAGGGGAALGTFGTKMIDFFSSRGDRKDRRDAVSVHSAIEAKRVEIEGLSAAVNSLIETVGTLRTQLDGVRSDLAKSEAGRREAEGEVRALRVEIADLRGLLHTHGIVAVGPTAPPALIV